MEHDALGSLLADDRATMRAREREKRRRRKARQEARRRTVEALEIALPVIVTLDDNDDGNDDDSVLWEDILDPRALRVRQLMRKSIFLTKEIKRLNSARDLLKLLLREHHVASLVVAGIVARNPVDEWKADVERWRSIVRKHYRPRTMDECKDAMEAALKEMRAYQWSTEKQTTGASFLGWHDSRRIDHARGAFQFEFDKIFRGYAMKNHVEVTWRSYVCAQKYYEVVVGPQAQPIDGVTIGQHLRAAHEVLQEVDPNVFIVRIAEQYPDAGLDAHMVYLTFLEETDRGFIQCVRSICCPELVKAINEPSAVWPSNSFWLMWERLENDDQAYQMRIGGAMTSTDLNYVTQWIFEGLACVLRSERALTGRQLITCSE